MSSKSLTQSATNSLTSTTKGTRARRRVLAARASPEIP
jgi:hypothetical protein